MGGTHLLLHLSCGPSQLLLEPCLASFSDMGLQCFLNWTLRYIEELTHWMPLSLCLSDTMKTQSSFCTRQAFSASARCFQFQLALLGCVDNWIPGSWALLPSEQRPHNHRNARFHFIPDDCSCITGGSQNLIFLARLSSQQHCSNLRLHWDGARTSRGPC